MSEKDSRIMVLENKVSELTDQSAIVEREKVEWNDLIEQLQTEIKKLEKENQNLKMQNKIINPPKIQNEEKLIKKKELITSIKNKCLKLKSILLEGENIHGN